MGFLEEAAFIGGKRGRSMDAAQRVLAGKLREMGRPPGDQSRPAHPSQGRAGSRRRHCQSLACPPCRCSR